jgi:hypothetical protein
MQLQRHVVVATAFIARPFMPRWVVYGEMDPRAWLLERNSLEFEDADTMEMLIDVVSGRSDA